MRVLIIDPNGCGGICHYTYNLCQALVKEGVRVILATARDYELSSLTRQFEMKKVFRDVSVPPSKHLSTFPRMVIARSKLFLDFAELLLIIVMTKPDIVHFQWFRTFKPDYFYLRLLRLIGYRTVLTAHEVIPEFVSPEKYDRYASRLYRNFKKVIALTEPGKKELYTRYGVPEKAIHVSIIAHGDFSFFKSMAEKETDSRKRFGFREDSKIVLFFGRITYDKGLDQLLRSFKMVKERVPNARLLVAGALLESFLPYEKLICEFGLSDVVKLYLKKMVPFEEVPMCFRAADVVALPYRYSCQSGVLEVALAMGKPVVATDVGILRRVLPNGAGFIIPPGDVDLLAERLIEILRDETLLKHMSSIAGHAADQNRSWQVIARDFIGVYESICRNVAMEPDKQ